MSSAKQLGALKTKSAMTLTGNYEGFECSSEVQLLNLPNSYLLASLAYGSWVFLRVSS